MKESHKPFGEFPEEKVRAAIQKGIVKGELQSKRTLKVRKNVKKTVLITLGSMTAMLGFLIGSSYYSPAMASNLSQLPIIGSVFGNSSLIGLHEAQTNGLTSELGEKQTINGISITIEEILYDQNNITVGLIIESDKELTESYFSGGNDFIVNGKLLNEYTGGYQENIHSTNYRTALLNIATTKDMPTSFELGLIIYGENGEKWYFSTNIEKIPDIVSVPIHYSETVNGINLNVEEIKLSDTASNIVFVSSAEGFDMESSKAGNIEFLIVDQNDTKIQNYSGGVSGKKVHNRIVFESEKHFDPINENVKELTITPYLVIPDNEGGYEYDENKNPKKIKTDNSQQEVKFKPFKVTIPN